MTISILIVDDQPRAYKEFLDRVGEVGVLRGEIDIEQCGHAGLMRLESKQYDLVVVDIALPFRPQDDIDPQGALDVLEVVTGTDYQHRPNYILCITAFDSLPATVESYLEEHLIYLIKSSSANASWIANLLRFVEQIQKLKAQEQSVEYDKDVCIVTALRDPEFKAVRSLPWNWSQPKILNRVMSFVEGTFQTGSGSNQVVASTCSRMGMVEAALVVERLIQTFRPRLMVFSGICAGFEGETEVGQVVCASPTWNWQNVKLVSASMGKTEIQPDPDFIDIDERLRPFVEEFREDAVALAAIKNKWPAVKPSAELEIHIGPMASGSSVVADGSFDEIRSGQKRKTIGLDMETYGLFAVARSTPVARPLVLSLKSVCDHANYLKNDKFQSYAAYTSAAVIALFCERYFDRMREMQR